MIVIRCLQHLCFPILALYHEELSMTMLATFVFPYTMKNLVKQGVIPLTLEPSIHQPMEQNHPACVVPIGMLIHQYITHLLPSIFLDTPPRYTRFQQASFLSIFSLEEATCQKYTRRSNHVG